MPDVPLSAQSSGPRLSTHGLQAVGATLVEVRRGSEVVGRVQRRTGRGVWEVQPHGWTGWTGDFRLMRDAVAALGRVEFDQEQGE